MNHRPHVSVPTEALREARRVRGEWLLAVEGGFVELSDLIEHACTEEGRPLRRIRLESALAAQPGWTRKKARAVVASIARNTPATTADTTNPQIGWLTDRRANGARVRALAESLAEAPTHDQFPYRTAEHGGHA